MDGFAQSLPEPTETQLVAAKICRIASIFSAKTEIMKLIPGAIARSTPFVYSTSRLCVTGCGGIEPGLLEDFHSFANRGLNATTPGRRRRPEHFYFLSNGRNALTYCFVAIPDAKPVPTFAGTALTAPVRLDESWDGFLTIHDQAAQSYYRLVESVHLPG